MSERTFGSVGLARVRARIARVDWAKLNYVLITAGRKKRKVPQPSWETTSGVGPALFRLFRSFTSEGRALFVATLVTAAFSIDVSHTYVYVLMCVFGGTLVASLLVSRWLTLPALQVRLHAPPRVFVGAEAAFVLECSRTSPGPETAPIRAEGPFLPYFGRWITRASPMGGVGFGAITTTTFKARFSERGELTLGRFRVSALVPLGLASGPPIETAPLHLKVVPRPANVVRIDLPLSTKHQPGGIALASKTGESMDLRGVRPYKKGDRIRDLSARTWARTGKPAVREYQEEYFTRVGVVLDCVAPKSERTDAEAAFEAAVSLAAGIVARLGRGDALVDLLVTGGEVHALTLGRSLGFLEQALDHLAVAELEEKVDRTRLLKLLTPYLARLSAVIVVVDGWDEDREAFVRAIEKKGVRVHCVAVGAPVRMASGAPVKTVSVASIMDGTGVSL
jgi:uncharacterized protein (DUF58 family)